uniref:15-hydroxyprostaglandin dehydrogenase [NAD(+)] n=1 Tax=Arion vulgaris TaxID=1028688 RepID=A0A0B7B6Z7_9EUPU
MDLSGKVIFITGAAQGLGKAYAEAVLEQGAKVFFGDVNSTVGNATFEELKGRFSKQNVRFTAFDVTDHQQFKDAFDLAVSTFGHVDVLVNNAGIMNESKWQLQILINYTALVYGTQLATEHMRKDKGGRGGRVINISSTAGIEDYYFIPVYCGTKHAVRSFTSALSNSPTVGELGVEYGMLCPDPTATDLILKIDNEKVHNAQEFKELMQGRILQVSDVVDGFMELVQLEKMNGAILQVTVDGQSYRKMVNEAV